MSWRSPLTPRTHGSSPPPLTFLVLLFQDDLHGGATSSLGFEAPGDKLQGRAEGSGHSGSGRLPAHGLPQALVL